MIASQEPLVKTIDPGKVGNSVQAGAKKFLGQRGPVARFAYVIAATADKDRAVEYARYLNHAIPDAHKLGGAQVLTLQGTQTSVITIGGLVSRETAELLRNYSVRLAAQSAPSLVPYLLEGKVIDSGRLAAMR